MKTPTQHPTIPPLHRSPTSPRSRGSSLQLQQRILKTPTQHPTIPPLHRYPTSPRSRVSSLRGELSADRDGILRSQVFPGLWLAVAELLAGDMQQVLTVLQAGLQSPECAAFVNKLSGSCTA